MNESWVKIDDYFYEVSNLGNIRSSITGKLKSKNKHKSGYVSVSLWKDNKEKRVLVHRLVAKYFIGEISGMEVNHKNFNKEDNSVFNLEIITKIENVNHAKIGKRFKGNIKAKGESNPSCKLTTETVLAIRLDKKNGLSKKELLAKYPIKKSQLWNITSGKSWYHV